MLSSMQHHDKKATRETKQLIFVFSHPLLALQFIQQVDDVRYRILKGAVPNMNVEGMFYVNDALKDLVFEELEKSASHATSGHGM
jgi:hypothetical protein